MKKVYLYSRYERLWHWTQMALIFLLAITGFEIHGSYALFGFEEAVEIHDISAIALLVLTVFTIFWDFTTGQWRLYIPHTKNFYAQVEYYLKGIFKNANHPVKKTILNKFNPIQGFVYVGLKLVLLPLLYITGLIYFFHQNTIFQIPIDNIELVAILHLIGAFLMVTFIVLHVYLITTGTTIFSNLKSMITGWEDLHDDEAEEVEKELIEQNKKFFKVKS